jgi:hypothetical protein
MTDAKKKACLEPSFLLYSEWEFFHYSEVLKRINLSRLLKEGIRNAIHKIFRLNIQTA